MFININKSPPVFFSFDEEVFNINKLQLQSSITKCVHCSPPDVADDWLEKANLHVHGGAEFTHKNYFGKTKTDTYIVNLIFYSESIDRNTATET